jgi:hypothetical protein
MRTTALIATVFCLCALTAVAPRVAAQTAADQTGAAGITLRGIVVDAADGAPLLRARVTLTSGRTTLATISTDADGQFAIGVAQARAISIRIVKAGYASVTRPVTLEQIRGPDPLRIEVPRGAVIAGRAVDASGEPASLVTIRRVPGTGAAWSPSWLDGTALEREFLTIQPDENGEFRVPGLIAGRYTLDAYPSGMLYQIQADRSAGLIVRPMSSAIEPSTTPPPVRSITIDLDPGTEASGVSLLVERTSRESPAPDPMGGTVSGIVSATDGSPIADATVTAGRAVVGVAPTTRTDGFGRFTLRGISPGPVFVRASKRGYVPSQPGQRGGDLPAQDLTIEPGKDLTELSIEMPRAGTISGMVLDEYGDPIQEASVQLVRVQRQPTGALVAQRDPGGFGARSDDRGRFRLPEILPGDYTVMASVPQETSGGGAPGRFAYMPAYYPDTSDFANAGTIRIRDGEVVPGLIFTMRRVPVARVTGVAYTSNGLPLTGTIRLMSRHAVALAEPARSVRPGPDGEFAFADVPPGDYLLRTAVDSGPSARETAMTPIVVRDRDPEPVMIRTSAGSTISGRIVLDGGGGQVLWGYSAGAIALDADTSTGSVTSVSSPVSTGESFTIGGLTGPARVRIWSDDQNWYLKSITLDGFDITDIPFDFGSDARAYSEVNAVFARPAAIAGRVTDDRGAAVRDYVVYVFPVDRDKWFAGSRWVRQARASADGGFQVRALPPGDYWVAAVDRSDGSGDPRFSDGSLSATDGRWADAELLTRLASRASRVALGEGQEQRTNLRVIGVTR